MEDLNTLIPPGASLDLTYAVAINDRGEIVGFGVPPGCALEDYESCGHAYMLIPCRVGEECANVTLNADSASPAMTATSAATVPAISNAQVQPIVLLLPSSSNTERGRDQDFDGAIQRLDSKGLRAW